MTKKQVTLVLIDGHAIIHRAYHAFPPTLRTSSGEQVNAVYGFTALLLEVLNTFNPEYVLCAFDSRGKTQRHDMFVDYKANRSAPDDELVVQFPRIEEVVNAFNIPVFKQEGFEADDILGTIVSQDIPAPRGYDSLRKIIVTGDQDILQLIEDDTYVYLAGNRFSKSKLYDAEAVRKKYTFGPEYVVDYKALRGDPSDNIPGVKGIGDKGAKKLIGEFGHLETMLAKLDEVTPDSVRQKLLDNANTAELSKKLATIIKDVPLHFELEKAELADYNYESVKKLFMELQFRSLIGKIPESKHIPLDGSGQQSLFGKPPQESHDATKKEEPSQENYKIVKTQEEIDSFIEELSKQELFAFDTETTGLDTMRMKVLGLSVSWQEQEGWYLDMNTEAFTKDHVQQLKRIFENPKVKLIGHNIKFDAHALSNSTIRDIPLSISLNSYYFDTMIAAYVLQGGSGSIGLKGLAFNKLGMTMADLEDVWERIPGFKKKKNYKPEEVEKFMRECDQNLLGKYACADADATYQLYKKYCEEFESESKLEKLFYEFEMPTVKVLYSMEREGIHLDVKYLRDYGKNLDTRIASLANEMYSAVGHEFNINSPKQVGEVLFDEIGLPGGKKTKTGAWQTNEKILETVIDAHPMIPALLEFRELSKLRSTYVESLIDQVNPETNKIHTSYNQTIATTGRLSSTNPNLQNIPVATEEGAKIRKAFQSQEGELLVAFDISQQELRILAHMSDEENLKEAYKDDVDVHALTASKLFDVDVNQVTKDQRSKGKVLNFSLMYGISSFGLAKNLKISREEAQILIDHYFVAYPRVKEFFDTLLEDARQSGRVETMFGRYRETSGLHGGNYMVRSATEREVINFPIQGTAADMVKKAMIDCFEYISHDEDAQVLSARMLLQVHDELIFAVKKEGIKDFEDRFSSFTKKITEIMETGIKLSVPVKVGVLTGEHWSDLK